MSVVVPCPRCSRLIMTLGRPGAKAIRCPGCGKKVRIPKSASHEMADDEPVIRPCPDCRAPLRLAKPVRGARVRCNACRAVFKVAADSWELTRVEDGGEQQPLPGSPPPLPHGPPPLPKSPPGPRGPRPEVPG